MSFIYDNVTDKIHLDAWKVLGLTLVSIPSYFIIKDCLVPKASATFHNYADNCNRLRSTRPNQEEDVLEAKVKSENLRPGPAFLNSHVHHNRRIGRVKSAYTAVWTLVNQNLDLGNRDFKVALTDNDVKILNVVRRLLIDELEQDGYSATISIHLMNNNAWDDNITSHADTDSIKPSEYYFDIAI